MKRIRLNPILSLISEFVVYAVAFGLPIIIGIFPKTYNVFEQPKVLFFKIAVLLLLFTTVIKIVINFKEFRSLARDWNSLRALFRYFIAPLIFLAFLTLATVFSIDPQLSFNGLYQRFFGLDTYLYCFLFFVLLLIHIRNFKEIKRVIVALVWSSFLVSLYAILQSRGIDFFHWNETFAETGRATSTFGQTNYLATYLLIVVPLAGYLFIRAKNYLFKIIYSILIIFELIALYLSVSLTAWCALIVGVLWFILFYYFIILKKRQADAGEANRDGKKPVFRYPVIIVIILISLAGIAYRCKRTRSCAPRSIISDPDRGVWRRGFSFGGRAGKRSRSALTRLWSGYSARSISEVLSGRLGDLERRQCPAQPGV